MFKVAVKIDENNIIKSCGIYINNIKPLEDGIDIEVDNTDIDLVDNYKLVNGQLIKLTEEEKKSLITIQKSELEILKETVDALVLANLGV